MNNQQIFEICCNNFWPTSLLRFNEQFIGLQHECAQVIEFSRILVDIFLGKSIEPGEMEIKQ